MSLSTAPPQLLARCRDGEFVAFEQLFGLIRQDLYRIAYSFLRDHDDTDEVLQESLIRMFRHFSALKDLSKFSSWTMRILVNQCHTLRARKGRQAYTSLDELGEPEEPAVMFQGGVTTPRDSLIQKERMERIQAAIAELPERQRMSILLFEIEGLSIREAADTLRCSEGAVKFNIHQARRKLQKALAGEWSDVVSRESQSRPSSGTAH